MRLKAHLAFIAGSLLLVGCGTAGPGGSIGLSPFSLVRPGPERVTGGRMIVTPATEWNKIPRSYNDLRSAETWTLNGPYLDTLTLVGGLRSGRAIVHQRRKADRKVPAFRSDMTAQEIVEMIESLYMIRLSSLQFEPTELKPRTFLGFPGFQLDYNRLGGDEVKRRGRVVGAAIDGRLYLIMLDAAQIHYFHAGLPQCEAIVESAALRGEAA